MQNIERQVLKAYLCDGLSHREIQRDILGLEAPARGGGFEAMKILHKYGVKGEHKAILRGKTFDADELDQYGDIETYLHS